MNLTGIDKATLARKLSANGERIRKLEAFLQGVPMGTARFADASIETAKILSLAADKISAGDLIVAVGVGSSAHGSIILDGVNVQERMSDDSNVRVLIGAGDNGFTVRVSLAGTDADEASPDPRDYSLLADEDNILIKEQSRGSASVANNASATINHALGYPPHFMGYTEVSSGRYKITNGYNIFGSWRCYVNSSNLIYNNNSGSTNTLKYFIFYDDIN